MLKTELYRNLLLAAVCVFIVTLILIAKLWTSILVFVCVVFTVVSYDYYCVLLLGPKKMDIAVDHKGWYPMFYLQAQLLD